MYLRDAVKMWNKWMKHRCNLLNCERHELEMYHYSFVRLNILSKLINVTNRGNYTQDKLNQFITEFPNWFLHKRIILDLVSEKE